MKVEGKLVSSMQFSQAGEIHALRQNSEFTQSTLVSANDGFFTSAYAKVKELFTKFIGMISYAFKSIFYWITCRSKYFVPAMILKSANIESEHVRKFNVLPDNKEAQDYFKLTEVDKDQVLKGIMGTYKALEEENPAAGYKVRFVGANAGKNPMEAELSAFGLREIGSEMAISDKDPFCALIAEDKKFERYPELTDSKFRVIKTLQDNALIISGTHKKTWFELTHEEQKEMLDRADRVLQKCKRRAGDKQNYEIVIHNGIAGHQNVGHVHMHILIGNNRGIY